MSAAPARASLVGAQRAIIVKTSPARAIPDTGPAFQELSKKRTAVLLKNIQIDISIQHNTLMRHRAAQPSDASFRLAESESRSSLATKILQACPVTLWMIAFCLAMRKKGCGNVALPEESLNKTTKGLCPSNITIYEMEGVEVLVPVEGVGVFAGLEAANDQIGNRCGQHLVADFQQIPGEDHLSQGKNGIQTAECEGDHQGGVDSLADDGRPDRARPQLLAVGQQLHPGHGVGIGEIGGPERDKRRRLDSGKKSEYHLERLLIFPARGARQRNHDAAHQVEQHRPKATQPDCAARCGETI